MDYNLDQDMFFPDSSHSGALVMLNVYDLDESWLKTNKIFGRVLGVGGAFHAGVEVYGTEIAFGCDGIWCHDPRGDTNHVFRESVVLGKTGMSPEAIERLVRTQLSPAWTGESYHLLNRNCCSFAKELCANLVEKPVPGWIDRLARSLARIASFYASIWDIDWLTASGPPELCTRKLLVGKCSAVTSLAADRQQTRTSRVMGKAGSLTAERLLNRAAADLQANCRTPCNTGLAEGQFGRLPWRTAMIVSA